MPLSLPDAPLTLRTCAHVTSNREDSLDGLRRFLCHDDVRGRAAQVLHTGREHGRGAKDAHRQHSQGDDCFNKREPVLARCVRHSLHPVPAHAVPPEPTNAARWSEDGDCAGRQRLIEQGEECRACS